MFEVLFSVIISGILIMFCLFLYWFKFIYIDKDESGKEGEVIKINNKEKEDRNQKAYPVAPNFLKKVRKKKE